MSPCASATRPCAHKRRAASSAGGGSADRATTSARAAPSSGAVSVAGGLVRKASASFARAASACVAGLDAGSAESVVGSALGGAARPTKTGFSTGCLPRSANLSDRGQKAKMSASASAAAPTPKEIRITWDILLLPSSPRPAQLHQALIEPIGIGRGWSLARRVGRLRNRTESLKIGAWFSLVLIEPSLRSAEARQLVYRRGEVDVPPARVLRIIEKLIESREESAGERG